jgi:hypothetical protein
MYAEESDLLQLARTRKIRMKKFKALLENIGNQRNKILAHLDIAIIENPQEIRSLPFIDMNEVEQLYLVMLDILNGYSEYYDKSEYYMRNLNEGVEEDLTFLLSRISKHKG